MAGRLAAVAVAVTALIGAGCGDDGEPAAEGDSKRVVIEAREGAFDAHQIFEAVAPGVVTIRSVFSEGPLGGPAGGQGSGFVLNDAGEIATNAHVVTDAELGGGQEVNEARQVYVEFPDRNQVEAEIVGWDPHSDVALLKVDPGGLDLDPVALGSSSEVRVGDPVAAIGSPFGAEQSLSVGIVSARRAIQALSEFRFSDAIQTDASINRGNSGGPLIDAEGKVIGLNEQIASTTGNDEGVGFAVPIDLAKRAIEQLREDGEVSYAYVGLTTQALYPQLAERLDLDVDSGALVGEVIENGPADEAGIRGGDSEAFFQAIPEPVAVGGDVILSVDGEQLIDEDDFAEQITEHDPGDEVVLEILRDGDREEITVELGDRSEAAAPSPG